MPFIRNIFSIHIELRSKKYFWSICYLDNNEILTKPGEKMQSSKPNDGSILANFTKWRERFMKESNEHIHLSRIDSIE